jgi:hypothetical protein
MNFPGEEGSHNKAIISQFTINDHKKFTRFLFPNGEEFSPPSGKDAPWLGKGLKYLRPHVSEFPVLLSNVCPAFTR